MEGYNTIPGGYHIVDQTLVDNRMYFETLADRDNLDPLRISSGLFTFIRETEKAYIAEKIDGVVSWNQISGYKYEISIILGANEWSHVDQENHLMPSNPFVQILSLKNVEGMNMYEPVECYYGFDNNNDFHIKSSSDLEVIIKMISNG